VQKRVIISFGKIICGDLCRKTICLNTIYFVVNTLKNTRLKKKDGYFAIEYLTEKAFSCIWAASRRALRKGRRTLP